MVSVSSTIVSRLQGRHRFEQNDKHVVADLKMRNQSYNPRILIVTPEVSYLPDGMGEIADHISVGTGKLADISAALITALFEQGVDIHVALPDYRTMFNVDRMAGSGSGPSISECKPSQERIHLAKDRAFFYLTCPFANNDHENMKIALAFQREVINTIVPRVWPDFIHCVDWRTGLIPALARKINIPCLFTVTEIDTSKTTLSEIEDRGIDGAAYWQYLYYDHFPSSYEETREANPVDFLASGILSAHFVNILCPVSQNKKGSRDDGILPEIFQKALTNKPPTDYTWNIPEAEDSSCATLFIEDFLSTDTCDRHTGVGADSNSDTVIARKYIHYYEEILHHPITNATMH